ncbi:MFS transporter [Clavibacter michiganensis]|uniref:MFS transporter n=1 Tax=Clavibacter michiganensis TaxID=28447 RepID=UPI00345C39D7
MPDPAAPARGGGSADGHPDGTADGRGRTVLAVAILASFVAFLDGTVVNVALPAIGEDLGGGLIVQQWVVDAYLITLGALILLAGSLSDAFGRVRVLRWGLVGFGVTSLVCAIAPTAVILIAARAAQGAAGALLVPSSLALIAQAFRGPAQARAIGSWTAWTGMAMLVGPVLGGVLVDALDWRLVFGINVLPIAVTLVLLARLPHDAPVADGTRVDVPGAVLGALGIGGPVFALIEQSRLGIGHPLVVGSLVVGVACLVLFVVRERRTAHPMLPLSLFRERDFLVGNIATIGIYGALSLGGFVIAVFLQQTGGLSATAAGFALVPTTVIMLLLSTRFGALAGRIGPRLLMGAGPIVAGGGYLLMLRVAEPVDYWGQLLPGILVFGLGLSMTVAPLTATILEAVPPAQAGIASAVNNAVSRVAGLVAIAAIGLVAGPDLDVAAFHRVVLVTAALLVSGGLVSLVGIRSRRAVAAAPASGDAAG